jgi:hypothetical protein
MNPRNTIGLSTLGMDSAKLLSERHIRLRPQGAVVV